MRTDDAWLDQLEAASRDLGPTENFSPAEWQPSQWSTDPDELRAVLAAALARVAATTADLRAAIETADALSARLNIQRKVVRHVRYMAFMRLGFGAPVGWGDPYNDTPSVVEKARRALDLAGEHDALEVAHALGAAAPPGATP